MLSRPTLQDLHSRALSDAQSSIYGAADDRIVILLEY